MANPAKNFLNTFSIRNATVLLIILIALDLIFILLSFANLFLHINDPMLKLSTERGYSELFQYFKYFSISVLLIYISIKNSSIYIFSWVLVFLYLLIDDALKIHESMGNLIANHLEFIPPINIRLQDFGELLVTFTASIVLAVFVLPAYIYGSREFRKISQDLLIFLFLLFFFGVFIDIAYYIYPFTFSIKFIIITIEEGGEMVTASFILWYVYLLAVRGIKADFYICDFLSLFQNKNNEKI